MDESERNNYEPNILLNYNKTKPLLPEPSGTLASADDASCVPDPTSSSMAVESSGWLNIHSAALFTSPP
jgi:hypothetical protein